MSSDFDISKFPDLPGVYLMKDNSDTVIYIGKARSLKKRVSQYFQSQKYHSPKTRTLVKHIADIEYIVTQSEVEALITEASLIKKHKPRYNVRLKDDKRYPYIKITNSKYPRIYLTRRRLMDNALYFGPYTNAGAARKTLDIISRIFKVRKCKTKIDDDKTHSRPCLNYHIKRCLGPCTGAVSETVYQEELNSAIRFLKGESDELVKELEDKMYQLSLNQEYEAASVVRDQIEALKNLTQQQVAISGTDERDVISTAVDENAVYIQLFYIRNGNLVGRSQFTMDRGDDEVSIPEVLSGFIKQYYQDSPVPPEILVQYDIPEKDLIKKWLYEKSGLHVDIHVPLKGDKKRILDLAAKNAEMSMKQEQLKKDHQHPNEVLENLKTDLSLETLPYHIEGFDISNISGTDAVGSLVVFENGVPANSKYRQFNIKNVEGIDDFAMMAEVVHRRFSRILDENKPLPDLILIDGGPGQVSAAKGSLDNLNLDNIPLIGLAKQYEHIITPENKVIILSQKSDSMKLLMRIRDEAHRFAVSSHRRKRTAKLTHSALDGIPGIGESKKRALLEHFGTVDNIINASIKDLKQVEGISNNLAQKIVDYFENDDNKK
ncbi:excinuclease ABC, C subunit [Methanohalobium evestigatum Z-7303]|uniref:UvrABC system protein C n=1 Tax=Methanohalobium evestigatum (strain ATCC BAA-1072 / DSM 3721 / NBRC 107634 / OCM 161 / Z-7303) TaxID=644295 RepID=D7EBR0_METEZ|nr:excinuclease ABC subunit UvrC [Methanohalobium evestigatum]ADI74902.1 excinuclease ABC, C subunit [Methanohalobium evestigatum Z-7303]